MQNPHKYPAACGVYAVTMVIVDYTHNDLLVQVTPLTWSQMSFGHNADSSNLVFLPNGVKFTDQIQKRLDSILTDNKMGFRGRVYVKSTCHKKDLALMVFKTEYTRSVGTSQVEPVWELALELFSR